MAIGADVSHFTCNVGRIGNPTRDSLDAQPGGCGTADVLPRLPGQAVGAVGALRDPARSSAAGRAYTRGDPAATGQRAQWRFRAVLALIYHCGLRVGEAVALKPGHIDAQSGVVRIVEGKGGRMREVPITCQMVQGLSPVLELPSQQAVALSCRSPKRPSRVDVAKASEIRNGQCRGTGSAFSTFDEPPER